MADQNWKTRISERHDTAQAGIDAISSSARDAVATARERIESTYGSARTRADTLVDTSRDLARTGINAGSRIANRSLAAAEKTAFSARGLIAERPLVAVAVGVTAGIVLGFLANRLSRTDTPELDPVEDDEIYD